MVGGTWQTEMHCLNQTIHAVIMRLEGALVAEIGSFYPICLSKS